MADFDNGLSVNGEVVVDGFSVNADSIGLTETQLVTAGYAKIPAITKTQIGLPNVDNTADKNKPVSSALVTYLNSEKEYLASSIKSTHIGTIIDSCIDLPSGHSDGGAWIDRCQDKSWYTEPLGGDRWINEKCTSETLAVAIARSFNNGNLAPVNDFSLNTTGWTVGGSGSLSIANGCLRLTNGSTLTTSYAYCSFSTVIGKTYVVALDRISGTASGAVNMGTVVPLGSYIQNTPLVIFTFVATSTTGYLILHTNSNVNDMYCDFRNITVREVDSSVSVAGCVYQNTTDGKFYSLVGTTGQTEVKRGIKREYPKAGVLWVAEYNMRLIGYDLATGAMWMVFTNTVRNGISSVAAYNGQVFVSHSPGNSALVFIKFIHDYADLIASTGVHNPTNIANRNLRPAWVVTSITPSLLSNIVTDVDMAVVKGTPVDPLTGLPNPTILATTPAGLSIIRHDGTVIDDTYMLDFTSRECGSAQFMDSGYMFTSRFIADTRYFYCFFRKSIPEASTEAEPDYMFRNKASVLGNPALILMGAEGFTKITEKAVVSANTGLNLVRINPAVPSKSMLAFVTNTYNSGWMVGSIRSAWLSSTTEGTIAESVPSLLPLSQTAREWLSLYATSSDVYAVDYGGDIYKQTNGTGNFVALGQTNRIWTAVAKVASDMYAVDYGGDIYKQTNSTGNFVALGQAIRNWHGITSLGSDIYACVHGGDIYKQTGGVGDFVSLNQGTRQWTSIVAGVYDVYACDRGGDVYKQTNGTGNFAALGMTFRAWQSLTIVGADIYASVLSVGIYKRSNGTGDFVSLNQTVRNWHGITSLGYNVYACVRSTTIGDIYKMDTTPVIEPDVSEKGLNLRVKGTLTKTKVNTNNDLVAYSGFSASNYLEYPYTSQLDFGTGDFCYMGWFLTSNTNNDSRFIERSNPTATNHCVLFGPSIGRIRAVVGTSPWDLLLGASSYTPSVWNFAVATRVNGMLYVYLNGKQDAAPIASSRSATDATAILRVGTNVVGNYIFPGSLALWRISGTAPSADQIAQIYQDELPLFEPGGKCVIDGTSVNPTALSYDKTSDLVHVGTSWGKSTFKNLSRVSSEGTAVGTITSIASKNNIVAINGTSSVLSKPSINFNNETETNISSPFSNKQTVPFDFTATASQTVFPVPKGYTVTTLLKNGMPIREASSGVYWTRSFDGYQEFVTLSTACAVNDWIAMDCVFRA